MMTKFCFTAAVSALAFSTLAVVKAIDRMSFCNPCDFLLLIINRHNINKSTAVDAPCMKPRPFDMGKCMISCESLETSPWDMKLLEWDYDKEHDVSIYTYEVSALPIAESPQEAMYHEDKRYSNCLAHSGVSRVAMGDCTIDKVSLLYDGCCENRDVVGMTQAVTPQQGFKFTKVCVFRLHIDSTMHECEPLTRDSLLLLIYYIS